MAHRILRSGRCEEQYFFAGIEPYQSLHIHRQGRDWRTLVLFQIEPNPVVKSRRFGSQQHFALDRAARIVLNSRGLDPATLDARLRARNPQLFSDEAKLRAAEKGRDLAYKNRYPDFTLGISPIQYQNALKEWELMVEMNLPWQQSSRRAQEREAETLFAAANSRRDATANRMLADLADNLAGLDAAREAEKLADGTLLPQAQVAFRSALASYESGKIDLATLLEAQRRIRQAGQARLKAQVEARMRLAEIERLLGEEP